MPSLTGRFINRSLSVVNNAEHTRKRESGIDLRLLLLIALPNVASSAAETLKSFVDYAIVSQLGPETQAAVSSGAMIYFSLFAILLGTMICVTTVVSQSLGAGRLRDCSAYAWQGIWLSLLFGIVGFALWPIMPDLYAFIGHDEPVQVMETSYTRIRLLGLGVTGASVALGHFFNGIHRPMQNAYAVIGTTILNGVLTYGLVLGKWGLPAMGVEGAALGSVIASVAQAFWLLSAMCLGRQADRFEARSSWPFDIAKARRLVWVGWPSGVAFAMEITAWSVFLVVIIGMFGTKHLAATATCWRYTELSFMPAVGIGHAICTLVGRAIGEGRHDLARRRAMLGAIVNMSYMSLCGLSFVLFGKTLMGFFSEDPEVIATGVRLLYFVAVFQLFDAVAISYGNALRGAGDTRWPAVVGGVLAWGVMVGGSAVIVSLKPEWRSNGPWFFATSFVILVGIAFFARWRIGVWESIDVIGRPAKGVTVFEVVPTDPLAPRHAEDHDQAGF